MIKLRILRWGGYPGWPDGPEIITRVLVEGTREKSASEEGHLMVWREADQRQKMLWKWKSLSRVQLFVTPWTVTARLLSPWNSPGKNTGMGGHSLLQGIFATQGSNQGLPNCKQTLYHLSHQESMLYHQLFNHAGSRPYLYGLVDRNYLRVSLWDLNDLLYRIVVAQWT